MLTAAKRKKRQNFQSAILLKYWTLYMAMCFLLHKSKYASTCPDCYYCAQTFFRENTDYITIGLPKQV
jgi:hypothetical protein